MTLFELTPLAISSGIVILLVGLGEMLAEKLACSTSVSKASC